jgi:hypothetical protein
MHHIVHINQHLVVPIYYGNKYLMSTIKSYILGLMSYVLFLMLYVIFIVQYLYPPASGTHSSIIFVRSSQKLICNTFRGNRGCLRSSHVPHTAYKGE